MSQSECGCKCRKTILIVYTEFCKRECGWEIPQYHCHQCLLASKMNSFIWYGVFSFYTVEINTGLKNIKKNMNIFEVSIHFYCIKCKYLVPNE